MVGPSIDVEAGMPRTHEERARAAGADVAHPPPGTAILDTGAEATCLDIRIVGQLHLLRSGTARVIGSTSAAKAPTFHARIRLPALGLDLELPNAIAVDLKEHRGLALLGRDVLRDAVLIYNGVLGEVTRCLSGSSEATQG